jgi:YVTN family beta-propeller protein
VVPISTRTNTALKPVKVAYPAGGMAITPNGKTLYVISGQSGVVTPISTAANTALKPITVGSGPIAITIAAPYRH